MHGMRAFGENVEHLIERYPTGDPGDEVWMRDIGQDGLIWVSRDLRIRHNAAVLDLVREHRIGGFWLGGKNLPHCNMVRQLVRNWPRMKDLADKTAPPFIFVVPPHGALSTTDRFNL